MRDLIIKHRIFFGIIILLIVLTIPLTVIQVQQQQTLKQHAGGTDVSILLAPPSKTLSIGDELSVTIKIDNPSGESITAATITLNYPTDLLDYKDGSFNPDEGFSLVGNLDNTDGAFKFTVIQEPNSDPTLTTNGDINVGTLRFKALRNGSAKIEFLPPKITAQGRGDTPLTVTLPAAEENIYTISDAQRSDTASSKSTKLDYVLCGSGLKCENNIKVDTPDKEGFNKCLSNKNFSGADKINGKYLTRCNSDLYYFDVNNNNECSLVPGSNPSTEVCMPPESPKSEDYVPCEDSLLDSCDDNTTVEEACSRPSEQTKCLASAHSDGRDFRGADKINGKYLTCCSKPIQQSSAPQSDSPPTVEKTKDAFGATLNSDLKELASNKNICDTYVFNESCQGNYRKSEGRLSGTQCCVEMGYSSCKSEEINIDGKPGQQFRCQKLVIASAVTATLTIKNPDSITTGGSLEYSFAGFQPSKTLEMWVNRRGESGSDNKTGGFVYPDVNEKGEGGGTITELSESAGKYTLWAKGSNGVSAKAEFTVKPTLTIKNPDSITTGGSLEYSFAGFRSDEAVKIWVVDSPTGYVINKQADASGKGNYTVDGLSELPRTWTLKIEGETPERSATAPFTVIAAPAPAPGDTIITLPAGAFNYLFTDTKKAVPELKTSKDQSLTIYLYSSDVDPKNDLRGENAIKKTHESKLSNSEENPLSFNLGQVPAGTYKILLKSPKYLRALEDTRTITSAGGTIILALTKPLANGAGDANGDNSIDILDYNIIQGCIGIRADAICTDREGADVNDSGVANEIDFNVWKTSMSFKDGD